MKNLRELINEHFRTWELVGRDHLITVLCGPTPVPVKDRHWSTVLDDERNNRERYVLQKARKQRLIRYRASYRKWQVIV